MTILEILNLMLQYFQNQKTAILRVNQNDVPQVRQSRWTPEQLAERLLISNAKQRRYEVLRRAQVTKKYAAHPSGWHPPAKTSAGRASWSRYMR